MRFQIHVLWQRLILPGGDRFETALFGTIFGRDYCVAHSTLRRKVASQFSVFAVVKKQTGSAKRPRSEVFFRATVTPRLAP
jgi:hypothetical protein